jgi:hypothetical protein
MSSCRFPISTLGPAHLGALGPRNTFTANRRIRTHLGPSFFLFMRHGLSILQRRYVHGYDDGRGLAVA